MRCEEASSTASPKKATVVTCNDNLVCNAKSGGLIQFGQDTGQSNNLPNRRGSGVVCANKDGTPKEGDKCELKSDANGAIDRFSCGAKLFCTGACVGANKTCQGKCEPRAEEDAPCGAILGQKAQGNCKEGLVCKPTEECNAQTIKEKGGCNGTCTPGNSSKPLEAIINPPPPSPPCAAFGANGTCTAIYSGFGQLQTEPGAFITKIFAIILGIAGAIALFLIMRAGYTIMTSQGKPEQIQAGRDQLVSAIVGLLFLIFSFVILQVIGVDILKIPTEKGTGGGTGAPVKQSCSCMASGTCNAEKGNIQAGGGCSTGLVNCCVPTQ